MADDGRVAGYVSLEGIKNIGQMVTEVRKTLPSFRSAAPLRNDEPPGHPAPNSDPRLDSPPSYSPEDLR